jgi:hypothetical protein
MTYSGQSTTEAIAGMQQATNRKFDRLGLGWVRGCDPVLNINRAWLSMCTNDLGY